MQMTEIDEGKIPIIKIAGENYTHIPPPLSFWMPRRFAPTCVIKFMDHYILKLALHMEHTFFRDVK